MQALLSSRENSGRSPAEAVPLIISTDLSPELGPKQQEFKTRITVQGCVVLPVKGSGPMYTGKGGYKSRATLKGVTSAFQREAQKLGPSSLKLMSLNSSLNCIFHLLALTNTWISPEDTASPTTLSHMTIFYLPHSSDIG